MRKSRSKYQRIWEEYNNKKIPKGYHIHHIDGNRNNNTPKNLLCVSAKEHYLIHLKEYNKTGSLKHLAASLFLQPNDNKDKLPSVRVGFKHTKESKLKMSKSKLGKPSWNKGVKMSDEARKNMSDAHKGLKWSDEMKENFIKSRTGGETKKAKPLFFYGKKYRTTRECSILIGKSRTYIMKRLNDINNKDAYYE